MCMHQATLWMRLLAFWVGLAAIAVPMLQLLEQRCVTPTILTLRNRKGANRLALLAAAYMLGALRRGLKPVSNSQSAHKPRLALASPHRIASLSRVKGHLSR